MNSANSALADLGWSESWNAAFGDLDADGFEPARVVRMDREFPLVATADGPTRAELAVHLLKTRGIGSRAVVGDWVAVSRPKRHDLAIIEAILPRTTAFTRKDPGEQTGEQVLIANVDVVFVMQALSGRGVNLRRLERELVLAWESGAQPVVVLSKADIAKDAERDRALAQEAAHDVEVVVESAMTGLGLDEIRAYVPTGTSAALLGRSGVGKSTLINKLVGEDVLVTGRVRERDDKGRHTTVARELVQLPNGGVVIDTPGMRGLALWDAEEGIARAFPDIDSLLELCRFRDCTHGDEPGCAVRRAVEEGALSARRLESYRALQEELAELERKQSERSWAETDRGKDADMDKSYRRGSTKRGRS